MKTLLLPRVERSAPPRTAIFQQLKKITITKRIPSLATTQARRRETLMDTKEKQAVRPNTRRRRGALMRAAPQLQGPQRLRLAQAMALQQALVKVKREAGTQPQGLKMIMQLLRTVTVPLQQLQKLMRNTGRLDRKNKALTTASHLKV